MMADPVLVVGAMALGSICMIRFIRSLVVVAIIGVALAFFTLSGGGMAILGDSANMVSFLVEQVAHLFAQFNGFIGDSVQSGLLG